jgi:hypothetical protein
MRATARRGESPPALATRRLTHGRVLRRAVPELPLLASAEAEDRLRPVGVAHHRARMPPARRRLRSAGNATRRMAERKHRGFAFEGKGVRKVADKHSTTYGRDTPDSTADLNERRQQQLATCGFWDFVFGHYCDSRAHQPRPLLVRARRRSNPHANDGYDSTHDSGTSATPDRFHAHRKGIESVLPLMPSCP